MSDIEKELAQYVENVEKLEEENERLTAENESLKSVIVKDRATVDSIIADAKASFKDQAVAFAIQERTRTNDVKALLKRSYKAGLLMCDFSISNKQVTIFNATDSELPLAGFTLKVRLPTSSTSKKEKDKDNNKFFVFPTSSPSLEPLSEVTISWGSNSRGGTNNNGNRKGKEGEGQSLSLSQLIWSENAPTSDPMQVLELYSSSLSSSSSSSSSSTSKEVGFISGLASKEALRKYIDASTTKINSNNRKRGREEEKKDGSGSADSDSNDPADSASNRNTNVTKKSKSNQAKNVNNCVVM